MNLPTWLAETPVPNLAQPTKTAQSNLAQNLRVPADAPKQLTLRTFEVIFPSVLEKLSEGYTLAQVFKEDHRTLPLGAFVRWMMKDPTRAAMYKEAKEIRSEQWAGKIIEIAEATDNPLEDVARSKLKVDTYKYLMGADNRKAYGDTKTIDVGGTISITAALAAAASRVSEALVEDATIIDRTEDQTSDNLRIAQDRAYDALMHDQTGDE